MALGLVLAISLGLGACAVEWGKDDSEDPSRVTPRERNQLYQEEQQRMYQQRQLDRSGPSDR
jgi:hypothetical protein